MAFVSLVPASLQLCERQKTVWRLQAILEMDAVNNWMKATFSGNTSATQRYTHLNVAGTQSHATQRLYDTCSFNGTSLDSDKGD